MTDEPFACVMFFDSETNEKIAYVALEDDGDYWTITASMEDDVGNISESIDKDAIHSEAPFEYVQKRYRSAITMVERLLACRAVVRVEEED